MEKQISVIIKGLERNSLVFSTKPIIKAISSEILMFEATRSHRLMDNNVIRELFVFLFTLKKKVFYLTFLKSKCKVLGQ